MTTTNLACHAAAAAYIAAKGPKAKAEILAYVAAKAEASSRVRWERLHKAILAGDKARIAYYAATGEAKGEALKALRQPKADPKAEPKAAKAKDADHARKTAAAHKAHAAMEEIDRKVAREHMARKDARKAAKAAPKAKTVSAPNSADLDARMAELVAAAKAAGLNPAQMAAFVKANLA